MLIKDREGIKVKIRCRSKIKIQMKYLLSSPPPGSIQRLPGLITEYCLCCLSAVMKPGIKRHTFRPSLLESVHGVALGSVRKKLAEANCVKCESLHLADCWWKWARLSDCWFWKVTETVRRLTFNSDVGQVQGEDFSDGLQALNLKHTEALLLLM